MHALWSGDQDGKAASIERYETMQEKMQRNYEQIKAKERVTQLRFACSNYGKDSLLDHKAYWGQMMLEKRCRGYVRLRSFATRFAQTILQR